MIQENSLSLQRENIGMDYKTEDIEQFKKLYITHVEALVGFCNTYLKNREIAVDVVQESFYKLLTRYDSCRTDANALAFLYITAKNLCMDVLRQNKFQTMELEEIKDQLPEEDLFLDEIARQEMIRVIHSAINHLTGRGREIALLTLEGKTNPEIAEILGISINSVKSLKKDAYSKLRSILGNEYLVLLHVYFFQKN